MADYSKACDHDNIEKRPHARTWVCTDCGADVPEPNGFSSELGPIKLDYDSALNDSRVLNWRKLPMVGRQSLPCPPDKPFYVAWREIPWGASESRWAVARVDVGQTVPALAQWWADDLLGLPPCND